jgi:prepilin-type N-terminal cleavage/methylation domain-containing protein
VIASVTRSTGFSLVELLAVVAILAALAMVVAPQFSTVNPQHLDYAAREIAESIRFARNEALRRAEPQGFDLELASQRIRVFRTLPPGDIGNPIYDVRDPVSKRLLDVNLNDLEYASVDALTRTSSYRGDCAIQNRVYFDRRGVAWCSHPDNVLIEQQDITLTLGEHSRVIRLEGITGRITIL